MLNGYYSLMEGKPVTPYVTAGVGVAHHAGEVTAIGGLGLAGVNGDDNALAYKIGAGADFSVMERVTAFADYRYSGTSDAEFGAMTAEYGAHEVRAGVRYGF